MIIYRILGLITVVPRWFLFWPMELFKRIAGPKWFDDVHDRGFAGALLLEAIWMFALMVTILWRFVEA